MDWQALGKASVARRIRLGYETREKFAQAAGISSRLLSDIENGKRTSYDPATLVKLEEALKWEAGSVDALLAGGAATPKAAQPEAAPLTPTRPKSGWPGIWLAEITAAGLPEFPALIRGALMAQVQTIQSQVEHDLLRTTMKLQEYIKGGFDPVNAVEARMLVYQASPERAREKAWRLVVALAELDPLFLAVPAGASSNGASIPWSDMSTTPDSPFSVVPVFTSLARFTDYDRDAVPVAVSAQEIVTALPNRAAPGGEVVAAFVVNPGSPLEFTITDTSLRDAAALVGGEVELDPGVLD